MKCKVIKKQDGKVTVINPAPKARIPGEQEDVWLNRVFTSTLKKLGLTGLPSITIDNSTLPVRTYRNAWALNGKSVVVDMEKARSIHMDKLRLVRDKKLSGLDLEYMMALEENDAVKIKNVVDKKKALRDLPQTLNLESVKTPEELNAVFPEILKD